MAKTFREYIEASSLFNFNTTTGQIIPQTDSVLSAVKELMVDIFDHRLDVSDETPAGRLAEMIALAIKRFATITASYANQINPYYATGQILDSIGSLFNVKRTGATATVISVIISGTPNTVIPDGSLIEDKKGNRFAIQGEQTIPVGGTVSAKAVCTNTGSIEVDIGSVTHIITSVVGWSSVSNTSIVSLGESIESDEHLRTRIINSRWTGTAFVDAIRASIERCDNIDSVYVIENGDSKDRYLKDNMTFSDDEPVSGKYILLKAHSICIILYGKTLTSEDYNKIAYAIYSSKSAGCGYTALDSTTQGSVKGTKIVQNATDNTNGITYPIVFNTPVTIPFGVKISVNRGTFKGTDSELQEQIKNAIIAWANGDVPFVDGLNIGQSIYAFEIGSAVSDIIPSIQISNVQLSIGGNDVYSHNLFIYEIGVINPDSIVVSIN